MKIVKNILHHIVVVLVVFCSSVLAQATGQLSNDPVEFTGLTNVGGAFSTNISGLPVVSVSVAPGVVTPAAGDNTDGGISDGASGADAGTAIQFFDDVPRTSGTIVGTTLTFSSQTNFRIAADEVTDSDPTDGAASSIDSQGLDLLRFTVINPSPGFNWNFTAASFINSTDSTFTIVGDTLTIIPGTATGPAPATQIGYDFTVIGTAGGFQVENETTGTFAASVNATRFSVFTETFNLPICNPQEAFLEWDGGVPAPGTASATSTNPLGDTLTYDNFNPTATTPTYTETVNSIRAVVQGGTSNKTITYSRPLENINILVSDVGGASESQEVTGFLAGVPVFPTFFNLNNGAVITGPNNNILADATGSIVDGQANARFTFPSPVDEITINGVGSSEFVLVTITGCSADFGDAPDTTAGTGLGDYQTLFSNNGPYHSFSSPGGANPRIGGLVDADDDAFGGDGIDDSGNARDDDNTGDDESIALPASIVSGLSSFSQNVVITNTSGLSLMLLGWIDFDRSGTFDPDEGASLQTAANGTVSLIWPTIPADITPGVTYARFRLTTDLTADLNSSLGFLRGGEVEDHELEILPPLDSDGDGIPDFIENSNCTSTAIEFETDTEGWVTDNTNNGVLTGPTIHSTNFAANAGCDGSLLPSSPQGNFIYRVDDMGGLNFFESPNNINLDASNALGSSLEFLWLDQTFDGSGVETSSISNLNILLHSSTNTVSATYSGAGLTESGWNLINVPLDDATWSGTLAVLDAVLADLQQIEIAIEGIQGGDIPTTATCANAEYFGLDGVTFNCITDTDGDGIPDYQDLDSDNDGIADAIEAGADPANPADTDGDSIPDYLDLDSDNDGIPDTIEAGSPDTNGDGIVDCPTIPSFSADGFCDIVDPANGGTAVPDIDFDGDNIPDRLDLDSDNDGLPDSIEAGSSDADGDGIVDCSTVPSFGANGLCDDVDPANGGTAVPDTDFDGDGVPDRHDLDSDNDGLPDSIEAGSPDADGDGIIDCPTVPSFSADGFCDVVDPGNGGTAVPDPDTDGDGVPDRHDSDSDNDGIPDTIEANAPDANGDGIVDCSTAPNFGTDGFCPDVDPGDGGTAVPDPDTDGDGDPDRHDQDADGDGIFDVEEAGGTDTDGDGVVDCSTAPDFSANGFCPDLDSADGGTPLPVTDEDGDGIPDFRQLGFALQSPFYFIWNSFEEQLNIGTLFNRASVPAQTTVTLIDRFGATLSGQSFIIPALGQFDVPLNLFGGFGVGDPILGETYGTVKVEFTPDNSIDGHSALYRFSPVDSDIEFTVIKEYANSILGNSYAVANTFQPSLAAGERNYAVIHWLQLTNHNETAPASFTVNRYDQVGSIIDSRALTLNPLARFDIQAGHEDLVNGRTNEVSLIEVIPSDPTSPYGGELFRYGGDSDPGFFPSKYSFGLSDNLLNGDTNTKQAFVSLDEQAIPYIELYNLSSTPDVLQVEIKDYSGATLFSQPVAVGPMSQIHLTALGILSATNPDGIVTVSSAGGNNFFAKVNHYYYEPNGRVSATNTRHGDQPIVTQGTCVYNTFIDQTNFLRLFNNGTTVNNVLVEAFDLNGVAIGSTTIAIPAGQGLDADLITDLGLALPPANYGQVRLTPSNSNEVLSDLVRTRNSFLGAYIDLYKSLPVR